MPLPVRVHTHLSVCNLFPVFALQALDAERAGRLEAEKRQRQLEQQLQDQAERERQQRQKQQQQQPRAQLAAQAKREGTLPGTDREAFVAHILDGIARDSTMTDREKVRVGVVGMGCAWRAGTTRTGFICLVCCFRPMRALKLTHFHTTAFAHASTPAPCSQEGWRAAVMALQRLCDRLEGDLATARKSWLQHTHEVWPMRASPMAVCPMFASPQLQIMHSHLSSSVSHFSSQPTHSLVPPSGCKVRMRAMPAAAVCLQAPIISRNQRSCGVSLKRCASRWATACNDAGKRATRH